MQDAYAEHMKGYLAELKASHEEIMYAGERANSVKVEREVSSAPCRRRRARPFPLVGCSPYDSPPTCFSRVRRHPAFFIQHQANGVPISAELRKEIESLASAKGVALEW